MSQASMAKFDFNPKRQALLEKLLQQKNAASASALAIPRRENGVHAPLSFAQERLWFLDKLEADSSGYNVPLALRLQGALNVPVLQRCLDEILRRHEILRTCFQLADGQAVQVVHPPVSLPLPLADLSGSSAEKAQEKLLHALGQEGRRSFDLEHGPLIRANLFCLGREDHVLLLNLHHIVCDGWSVGILCRELSALYQAFSQGASSPLPELPIQCADFAFWQRDWLRGEVLDAQLAYWKGRLAGNLPALELPADRPRPEVQTYRGAQQTLLLPPSLVHSINTLGQREKATLFMTLLAAFDVLVCRYTGEEDVIVGSPIANRNRVEIEGLIGFFVNTLVLRADLSGNPSFRELLRRVRDVCREGQSHQDLPFEKLVEVLQPERRLDRNPLFQVLFALQNAPESVWDLPGLKVTPVDEVDGNVRFDFEAHLSESAEGLRCIFIYNTDLFEGSTVARMLAHFQVLLEGIAANPDSRILELPLLPAAERRQLLVDWNQTAVGQPGPACVHQEFEAQVERTPDRVALRFENQQLTYRALNQQANQLAHYLRKLGVGPDSLVGICVERSPLMVAAVLGILKAGGAYVPLDPAYPPERLAFILADTGTGPVVTELKLVAGMPQHSRPLVCLDRDHELIAAEPQDNPLPLATADNLAYVLYTSGSTGKPKGVAMSHRPLGNLIAWQARNSTLPPGAGTLQFASLNFDVSFQEIFATICFGGTLNIASQSLRLDPGELLRHLTEAGIQRLFLPFVALQQLAEVAETKQFVPLALREVITAGEQLRISPQIVGFFERLADCRLCNQYGPTESHVVTSHWLAGSTRQWPALPPIGRPIANARIYLLDQHLQPVPFGVPGELYIGGEVLARGYQNQPELTAERFVPDPFRAAGTGRLYQTGDQARYLADGEIEFLGRNDDQVKIRGYRVELGEVETILLGHSSVSQASVVAWAGAGGEKRLLAYVVPSKAAAIDAQALRDFLRSKLPDYMVPARVVILDSLPLTPSGKVNRKALPAPDPETTGNEKHYVAPRTPTEEVLASIWKDLLGVKQISVQDNFFELGGHSLLAVRVQTRVEKELHRRLPLTAFFRAPTIEELTRLLNDAGASDQGLYLTAPAIAGGRPPVFCLHFLSAGQRLARHLAPDWPVYAIESPFEEELRNWHEHRQVGVSVETLAARCLPIIKRIQPTGPYHLTGFCFGGVLAFEIARQLTAQGGEVAFLALLDAFYEPGCQSLSMPWARRVAHHARESTRQGPSYLWRKWRKKMELAKKRRAKLSAIRDPNRLVPDAESERVRLPQAAFLGEVLDAYDPTLYLGSAVLFRAVAEVNSFEFDPGPANGWDHVIKGRLSVEDFHCNHMDISEEPEVGEVAKKLKTYLSKL